MGRLRGPQHQAGKGREVHPAIPGKVDEVCEKGRGRRGTASGEKKARCLGKEGDVPVQTDQNSDPELDRTVLSMPH